MDNNGLPLFYGVSTGSSNRATGTYQGQITYRLIDSIPRMGNVTYYLDSDIASGNFDLQY